ncbi:MAG: peptidase S8 and S53 subtilisin kexin sedolisin [Lautropia sp.]|nr:peptidase S8 and S53 subtilisin kexin sedolisin [Lautropia sp.]
MIRRSTDIVIGVIDSGFSPAQAPWVMASRRFALDGDGGLIQGETVPDAIGHGSAVLEVMLRSAPDLRCCVAQVFGERGCTSAVQIASALDWLAAKGVRLINLSLGVRQDYPVLRQACERALAAGILLLAASPARGAPVYPAAYPGVWRVTGDARCAVGEWSWLDSAQADFGCIVRPDPRGAAGASLGCAAFSGLVASWLARHPRTDTSELRRHLQQHAAHVGIERRQVSDRPQTVHDLPSPVRPDDVQPATFLPPRLLGRPGEPGP